MTDETPTGFEEQLKLIETLTEQLESGQLSLADSLKVYEKGLVTVKAAEKTLNEAREKIDFLETKYVNTQEE